MEIDGGGGGDGPKWAPPVRGVGRERSVVEARVTSMVAQSEAVMATGVALVMGAGIAAMAAVNARRASRRRRRPRPCARSVHDT